MGHLEDLPGDPRRPAVRRDRPDLALPGLPLPTDLAETWQVNLTDELERRDRTEAGRSEPVAFTHNALHQVLERAPSNPASYTWDVHGNLKTRTGVLYGDAVFTHDWRDRLVQVQQGSTTTDIVLDPLGRMVGKVRHTPDGDLARAYLHDGDQVVLEYVQQAGGAGSQPERRHLWGRWIDDLAVEQVDTDGDGSLETTLWPITDLLGSVQLLTDADGTPVERITYDPDGTPHFWAADTTRPSVTRIAWTGDGTLPTGATVTPQAFEIGLSEPIDPASAATATATLTPGGGEPQTLTLTLAADSRTAYLTGAIVAAGTSYGLHVDGLTDTSHNPLWPEDATVTIADPNSYEILDDRTAPTLLAVFDGPDALYLLFDEPVEPAAGYDMTTAIEIVRSGQPVDGAATRVTANLLQWQPADAVGGLIPGGSYTLTAAHLTDLAGNPATASATFTHLATSDQMLLLAYKAPGDTQAEAQSAYALTTLFQGRTWHAEFGGYYYRARWYVPEVAVFEERDPAGYSDAASLYVAVGDDTVNSLDPRGRTISESIEVLNSRRIQIAKRHFIETEKGREAWEFFQTFQHWVMQNTGSPEGDIKEILPPGSLCRLGDSEPSLVDSQLRIARNRLPTGRLSRGHVTGEFQFGVFGLLAQASIRFGRRFGAAGTDLPSRYWFGRLLGSAPRAVKELHNYAHEFGHAYGEAINAAYRASQKLMERWNALSLEEKRRVGSDPKIARIWDLAKKGKKNVEDYAESFALRVVTEFE